MYSISRFGARSDYNDIAECDSFSGRKGKVSQESELW